MCIRDRVYGGLGELRVVCDGLVPVFNVVGPAFVAFAIVFGCTVALDVYKRQALYLDSRQVTLCFWMKADAIRI